MTISLLVSPQGIVANSVGAAEFTKDLHLKAGGCDWFTGESGQSWQIMDSTMYTIDFPDPYAIGDQIINSSSLSQTSSMTGSQSQTLSTTGGQSQNYYSIRYRSSLGDLGVFTLSVPEVEQPWFPSWGGWRVILLSPGNGTAE